MKKDVIIVGASSSFGIASTIAQLASKQNQGIKTIDINNMEPKIKSPKELKIKAVEQEQQIESAESNDDSGLSKLRKMTERSIPMSNKQKKARAANKRAKVARKVNRK